MKLIFTLLCLIISLKAQGQKTIFQVGEFNSIPKEPTAKLVENEFSTLSGVGNTVHITSANSCPQLIMPGQRIAFFINTITKSSISPENNLLLTVALISDVSWGNRTPVAVLFNKQPLWRVLCSESPQKISVFIPSQYIDKGNNVIQIRNEGMNIIALDAIQLEKTLDLGKGLVRAPVEEKKKLTENPQGLLRKLDHEINSFAPLGLKFQSKLLALIPYTSAKYIQTSNKVFNFSILSKNKAFFDPVTAKTRNIPWEPARRIKPLFEGTPKKIPCNLIPLARDGFIQSGAWCAVRNAEGVITILCSTSSKGECGKEVKVQIPLEWINKEHKEIDAELFLTSGFEGDTAKPLEEKREALKIKSDFFEYKFKLTRCSIIRLMKKGAKVPTPLKFSSPVKSQKIQPQKPKVTLKHFPSNYSRTRLRYPKGRINIQSDNYKAKVVKATRGNIDGAKNVVPYDTESSYIEISYPKGKKGGAEGASMAFGEAPDNMDFLGFWVFPKSTNKNKQVRFQFYFNYINSPEKNMIFECFLRTGKWQHVIIPFGKARTFPSWGSMVIYGNPKFSEYKNGGKVSFEINNISAYQKPNELFRYRLIEEKDKAGQITSLTVLFFGRPGKKGECKYAFKSPIDFSRMKSIGKLPPGSQPELTYQKNAQILQINYQFPRKYFPIPEKIIGLLSKNEKKLITDRAFLCIGLKFNLK